MAAPKGDEGFDILDDNFWDDFGDDTESPDVVVAADVSDNAQKSAARETFGERQKRGAADDSKEAKAGANSNDEDSLFVATGLCADDLENCFDDDFDEGANEKELRKKGRRGEEERPDPKTIVTEISSDAFSDDSLGWPAEPEVLPRKRKFPGPAGILPKSRSSLSFAAVGRIADERTSGQPEPHDDLLCTPWSSEAEDPHSPWQRLKQDLEMDTTKGRFLQGYSIAWVLKMKRLQQLPMGKVPVLCVSVKNASKDILTLRDGTGEILATIDKSCQDYKPCLKAGTAVVLMKASVYVNDQSRHCLVLTRQNIVQIYSCAEDSRCERVDVNPMTLQELEVVCTQLQREALEEAAKRQALGLERESPTFEAGGSPRLESRGGGRALPLAGSSRSNVRGQWSPRGGNNSPRLFSNVGRGTAPLQPGRAAGVGSVRSQAVATVTARGGAVPVSKINQSASVRASGPRGVATKRPAGAGFGEDVAGISCPQPLSSAPKVPAYKPPVRSSVPTNTASEVSVLSLLKSAGGKRPQATSETSLLDNGSCGNGVPSAKVVSATLGSATWSPSVSGIPKEGETSAEEISWLEDDADDIFKTIDDVCLI